jgi:hypothetical protein
LIVSTKKREVTVKPVIRNVTVSQHPRKLTVLNPKRKLTVSAPAKRSVIVSKVGTQGPAGNFDAKIAEIAGAPGGLATLNENGLVPADQLPSYVDDVVEFNDFDSLPDIGEVGKIYVTLDNNLIYRWSGTVYVEIATSQAYWTKSGNELSPAGGENLAIGNETWKLMVSSSDNFLTLDTIGANAVIDIRRAGTSRLVLSGNNIICHSSSSLKVEGNVGFFGAGPVSKPTALTAIDSTPSTGDNASIIDNTRTRLAELESKLKSLGLIN